MNDYKYRELIEALREGYGYSDEIYLSDAADAIETLLTAVQYIPRSCRTCRHWDYPSCGCEDGSCMAGTFDHWEWNGKPPEKIS